jgi:hypothetical protein
LTAYFGYLGIQTQTEGPIKATQTAEAQATTLANLVTTSAQPSETAEPQAITLVNWVTPTNQALQGSVTITSTPTAKPSETPIRRISTPASIGEYDGYFIVQPSCNCAVTLPSSADVLVRLRWGAKTATLAERGADFISYTVTFDSKPIQGIERYRKPAIFVEYPSNAGDPSDAWWVYWDYPIGTLTIWRARHTIEATLVTLAAVDTGWNVIPAGTKKTFRVTLGYLPAHPPP